MMQPIGGSTIDSTKICQAIDNPIMLTINFQEDKLRPSNNRLVSIMTCPYAISQRLLPRFLFLVMVMDLRIQLFCLLSRFLLTLPGIQLFGHAGDWGRLLAPFFLHIIGRFVTPKTTVEMHLGHQLRTRGSRVHGSGDGRASLHRQRSLPRVAPLRSVGRSGPSIRVPPPHGLEKSSTLVLIFPWFSPSLPPLLKLPWFFASVLMSPQKGVQLLYWISFSSLLDTHSLQKNCPIMIHSASILSYEVTILSLNQSAKQCLF